MPTNRRLRDHWKRWNIPLNEERELGRFRNRLSTALLNEFAKHPLAARFAEIDDRFAFEIGMPCHRDRERSVWLIGESGEQFQGSRLQQSIEESEDLVSVVDTIQALFWAVEEVNPDFLHEIVQGVNWPSKLVLQSITE